MQFNSRDPDGEIFLDAYKQFFGYSLTFFFINFRDIYVKSDLPSV